MEHSIGVGIIIGIIVTIGTIVYKSDKFTANQKRILLPFLVFLPLGLFLIIATWIYNELKNNEHSSSPAEPHKKALKSTASYNVKTSNRHSTIKQETKSNNDLSETEFVKRIESCNQKKELLIRSYNDGLFNSKEYDQKISELEAEISKLNHLLTLKRTTNKVLIENKSLFDRLLELKEQELITSDEYRFKYNELLSSILQKIELQKEEMEKDRHQEFNHSDRLIHQEIARDRTKTYYLLGFSLFLLVTVSIFIFQYSSNTSNSDSSYNVSNTQVYKSNSGDEITKYTLHSDKTEIDKSNKIVETEFETPLDRIYLGTNLFHEGSGGTWGRATITKKSDHYWIKGEHKMSGGDWVKIEGKILNPTTEGFTFNGKITAYSPSSAESVNKYEFLRKNKDKVYGDTCIWIGETTAYKLFENRKYWRIKTHDCYHYTTDIDIFHN